MNFDYSETQLEIVESVRKLCAQFDDKYWQNCDHAFAYPEEFVAAMTDAGWLSALIPETYGGKRIDQQLKDDVTTFFALFVLCFLGVALALAMIGLDFATAFSGAATALANVGPGIGDIIGPAGNFQSLPDAAKWTLVFAMLLGRLELFPILVFLSPAYWRR